MRLPGLHIAGVMSHFPNADASNLAQTAAQIASMDRFCAELGLPEKVLVHTHNSAATVRLTSHRRAMVRVGAACYGVRTSRDFENPRELKPVMSFRTWVPKSEMSRKVAPWDMAASSQPSATARSPLSP